MDWTIANLEYVLQEQELKDVVIAAHWIVSKEVEGMTASSYGTQSFPTPTGDFIPYEDLTEAEVIGWVIDAMGTDQVVELEASLDSQIEAKLHPTTGIGTPWAASAGSMVSQLQ